MNPGKLTLMSKKWVILPNLLIALFFGAIGAYIKFAGLFDQDQHHTRVSFLASLFEKSFLPTQPYAGILSNVSGILWCFSAAICLFSALVLSQLHAPRSRRNFLLCSGLLLGALLLDDFFRITLILALLAGIPKAVMYGLYGLAAMTYGVSFRRQITKTPYLLLLLAGAFFVTSGLTEVLHPPGSGAPILLEDGTKLLGTLNAFLYFSYVCAKSILTLHPRREPVTFNPSP